MDENTGCAGPGSDTKKVYILFLVIRSEGASFSAVDLSGEEEKKMYTPGQTCTKPPVLTAMSPVRVSPTGLA